MRRYTMQIDGRDYAVDVEDSAPERYRVTVEGLVFDVAMGATQEIASIRQREAAGPPAVAPATAARGAPQVPRPAPRRAAPAGGGAVLAAPMPGVILRVLVVAGAQVQRGQDIAVLEAMKMENVIRATQAGRIDEICVAPGQQVAHGEAIVRYAAAPAEEVPG